MDEELHVRLQVIEDMLVAILRSNGNIHWVGGYAHGRTKKGDLYVLLYPAQDYLKEKVCRVYPQEFGRLPHFIKTQNIETKTKENPNRDEAQETGIYSPCPMFQILTWDGKDTSLGPEKRFGKVIRVTDRYPRNSNPPPLLVEPEPLPQLTAETSPAVTIIPGPMTAAETRFWEEKGRSAKDKAEFVESVKAIFPHTTLSGLETVRSQVCRDDTTKDNAPAQYEAVVFYITTRKKYEDDKMPTVLAHKKAIAEATAKYNREQKP